MGRERIEKSKLYSDRHMTFVCRTDTFDCIDSKKFNKSDFLPSTSALQRFSFIFSKSNVALLLFSFRFFHSLMTSRLTTSFIVHHRSLTKIALGNKIRAMISQFLPHERYFVLLVHENTRDSMAIDYLKSNCSFSMSKSSMIRKEKRKIGHFPWMNKRIDKCIYPHQKVTQWLEHLDYNPQRKIINDTIE